MEIGQNLEQRAWNSPKVILTHWTWYTSGSLAFNFHLPVKSEKIKSEKKILKEKHSKLSRLDFKTIP